MNFPRRLGRALSLIEPVLLLNMAPDNINLLPRLKVAPCFACRKQGAIPMATRLISAFETGVRRSARGLTQFVDPVLCPSLHFLLKRAQCALLVRSQDTLDLTPLRCAERPELRLRTCKRRSIGCHGCLITGINILHQLQSGLQYGRQRGTHLGFHALPN